MNKTDDETLTEYGLNYLSKDELIELLMMFMFTKTNTLDGFISEISKCQIKVFDVIQKYIGS